MRSAFLLLLCLLAGIAAAQSQRVETFVVRSQPAAALVEVVRPMLGDGAAVSAFRDRLIVNGSADDLARVRQLLADLDRPPRRLLIEVRQGGSLSLSSSGIGYGVDTGNVEIGSTAPGNRAEVRVGVAETRGRNDSLQRVQALDGRAAFIRSGEDVPVYQGYQGVYGGRVVQGFQMQYRNTGSGFYALPRVHGDRVTVEIHQQHERPLSNNRFATQQASTVLDGAIGQWLTLGSVSGSDSDRRNAIGGHYQTRREQDRVIELRVLTVD
ncbi:MAG: hypothetical protein KDI88_15920 [Gammaproteobacteria bacterium]|nr:hypothetical protein [Gammaproteobacteria bacterium]